MKIFGYGVGHFINDLTAACWFNYLFLFLKRVVKTSAAPSAILAGQITDGLTTPIVGTFSDRTKTKYGKIIIYSRSKDTLVCIRLNTCGCRIHTHFPQI